MGEGEKQKSEDMDGDAGAGEAAWDLHVRSQRGARCR